MHKHDSYVTAGIKSYLPACRPVAKTVRVLSENKERLAVPGTVVEATSSWCTDRDPVYDDK